MGAGRFYRGLYNVISSNSINLIPLRERQDDLLMLAQKFVTDLSNGEKSFSPEGIQKILSHYWTHNICELRSVIEASIEKAENDILAENEVLIGERRVSAMMSDDDSEDTLDESKRCGKASYQESIDSYFRESNSSSKDFGSFN